MLLPACVADEANPPQIGFLKEAREQIEKQKWELISQKMMDLGCKKKIPGTTCEKKWKELCPPPLNTQLQQMQGPNSASSASNDGFYACDMKRELSQVSEEDEEGTGLGIEE